MGLVHFYVVIEATVMQGRAPLKPVMFAVCDLYTRNHCVRRVAEGGPHRTGVWEMEQATQRQPTHADYPVGLDCFDEKVCYWQVPSQESVDELQRAGLQEADRDRITWSEYHTMTLHY